MLEGTVASRHFAMSVNGEKTEVICSVVRSSSAPWLIVGEEMRDVRGSSWCSSLKCQIRSVGISNRKKTLHNQRPMSSLTRRGSHRFHCLCQVVFYPIIQRELERKVCTSMGDSAIRLPWLGLPWSWWIKTQVTATVSAQLREVQTFRILGCVLLRQTNLSECVFLLRSPWPNAVVRYAVCSWTWELIRSSVRKDKVHWVFIEYYWIQLCLFPLNISDSSPLANQHLTISWQDWNVLFEIDCCVHNNSHPLCSNILINILK